MTACPTPFFGCLIPQSAHEHLPEYTTKVNRVAYSGFHTIPITHMTGLFRKVDIMLLQHGNPEKTPHGITEPDIYRQNNENAF